MSNKSLLKFSCSLIILLVILDQSIAANRLCGNALTQALDSICVNGFNRKEIKRSMDLDDYAYNEAEDDLPYPYASSPFLSKVHGGNANLMSKSRRRRHGVYYECCLKACTYSELTSYCL
ncbi:probable insulin-like peptide 1 [Teleopsis dalmanni]|uniref:probable insulin-like peptide 1 n=1 Tax=Teleopsis dalmanni TaxID=139649 RepID=UPI0018CE7E5F|nr:probable insulin-like peptide 1 [Teleopsis dalmanni]